VTLITDQPDLKFTDLGISDQLLGVIDRAGYVHPTPVQQGMIPLALAGRDVMGQARTGTGKTAAFVIPIWQRLVSQPSARQPGALVLVPTRELAAQVVTEFDKLAPQPGLNTLSVVGGERVRGQEIRLQRGAHVVVGTPGRVIDHLERKNLDLSALQVLVLDEADRMLDIGFRPDIERILRRAPQQRQTLLLSATLPPPILRLAHRYMQDPERLNLSDAGITVETIEQHYFTVDQEQKFDLLCLLLERERPQQAIIFCRTKRRTELVFRKLSRLLRYVGSIHGDMRQTERNSVMSRFRSGEVRFLVATDVVGRGIDVSGISHIINYDIPDDCDDYVHRVGRTGRMGREGVSYTFATPDQGDALTRIEMRIDRLLKPDTIPLLQGDRLTRPQGSTRELPLTEGDSPEQGGAGSPEPSGDAPAGRRQSRRRHRRGL
jgi:ATP-dependent RNA helicase DeaD